MAVPAGADVAGGIERIAAQRARRAAGADDSERALHERSRGVGGEADAQEVGPVLVVVVDIDERLALGLALLVVLARRPRLDQDLLRVTVPARGSAWWRGTPR